MTINDDYYVIMITHTLLMTINDDYYVIMITHTLLMTINDEHYAIMITKMRSTLCDILVEVASLACNIMSEMFP